MTSKFVFYIDKFFKNDIPVIDFLQPVRRLNLNRGIEILFQVWNEKLFGKSGNIITFSKNKSLISELSFLINYLTQLLLVIILDFSFKFIQKNYWLLENFTRKNVEFLKRDENASFAPNLLLILLLKKHE